MTVKSILLVEDNPDDVELALRSFRKHRLTNTVVVTRDGAEAIDYLFGTGAYSGRDPEDLPAMVLLDLKLPKIDGLGVLRRIRRDERTRPLAEEIARLRDQERIPEDGQQRTRQGAHDERVLLASALTRTPPRSSSSRWVCTAGADPNAMRWIGVSFTRSAVNTV